MLAAIASTLSAQPTWAADSAAVCTDSIEWRVGPEPKSRVVVDYDGEARFVVWAVGPDGTADVIASREDGSKKRYAMQQWTPIFFDAKKVEIAVSGGATSARGCIRQMQ